MKNGGTAVAGLTKISIMPSIFCHVQWRGVFPQLVYQEKTRFEGGCVVGPNGLSRALSAAQHRTYIDSE